MRASRPAKILTLPDGVLPEGVLPGDLLPAKPLPEPDNNEPEDKTTGNFRSDGNVQLVVAYSDLFDEPSRQTTDETDPQALPWPIPLPAVPGKNGPESIQHLPHQRQGPSQ